MKSVYSVLIAAVLASGAMTTAAYARGEVFTAKFETAVSEQGRVIAQNTVWTCEGDTCLARPTAHGANVRACRQLVRATGGRVIAYGPEGSELTADEIARCNGETAVQQAQN